MAVRDMKRRLLFLSERHYSLWLQGPKREGFRKRQFDFGFRVGLITNRDILTDRKLKIAAAR